LVGAKRIFLHFFPTPENSEHIPVSDASGRVLYEPVFSNRTNPPLLLAGPDGIAVKSKETTGAGEDNRIELEAPRVNTGIPMPEGFDAVIPVEEVIQVAEKRYQIRIRSRHFRTLSPVE
jgi:putative molybdopterin biosynthesis protein